MVFQIYRKPSFLERETIEKTDRITKPVRRSSRRGKGNCVILEEGVMNTWQSISTWIVK